MLVMIACLIVVCGVLIASLLAYRQTRNRDVASVVLPKFDQIVYRGLDRNDPSEASLLRQFQFAEASMIGGNTAFASEHFSTLRSRLLMQTADATGNDDDLRSDMLRWVEYRLSQL